MRKLRRSPFKSNPHSGSTPAVAACRLLSAACRFLSQRTGDLVWSTLIFVTVLLPLASLTLDVPRYVVLRQRLQTAADAAATATAQCVDYAHFQNTGETRLEFWCRLNTPSGVFYPTVGPLFAADHYPSLSGTVVDEANDTVTVTAQGVTRLFFGLTPQITIRVEAEARYRIVVE